MFNVGAGEMILIALVLLIAVGPEQLPGVIRRTGRIVGELKTMSDNLRRDFNNSLSEIERAADVKSWAGPELEETVDSVKEAATEPFKTDFTIDGSTKVTDIWASPPSKSTDESSADEAEQAAGETGGTDDSDRDDVDGTASPTTSDARAGIVADAAADTASDAVVDVTVDTDADADAETGPSATGEVA